MKKIFVALFIFFTLFSCKNEQYEAEINTGLSAAKMLIDSYWKDVLETYSKYDEIRNNPLKVYSPGTPEAVQASVDIFMQKKKQEQEESWESNMKLKEPPFFYKEQYEEYEEIRRAVEGNYVTKS